VVPWDVAQSIRQRVAALPAAAQELLGVAAVAGRVTPRAVLIAVATRPEEEVLGALEAACRAQLLEEEGAETYRFAHDVIREVIEADLSAARRAALHRRVAEALEAGPGISPVELLADHYARAGVPEKAVFYLERAGDKARAQFAPDSAERFYGQVVERLDRLGRAGEAAAVREKLGEVLTILARYDTALAVLEAAAAAHQAAGEHEGLRRTLAQIGRVHGHGAGPTPQEGLARLEPLLPALEASEPSPGLAALYVALGELFQMSGRHDDELAAAKRAEELARAAHDEWSLVYALMQQGMALGRLGHLAESLRMLEEAIPLAEAVGHLESLAIALSVASDVYKMRGDFDTYRRYTERAIAVTEQWGDPTYLTAGMAACGELAFYAGQWEQARADYERAMLMNRQIGASWSTVIPVGFLAQLCLAEGAWDEAAGYLEEALAVAAPLDVPIVQCLVAEVALRAGRAEDARARLAPLCERRDRPEYSLPCPSLVLAEAHLALGEVVEAEQVVARAIAAARDEQARLLLVEALRVQAMVRIKQGRWAEAERALEEGLSLARGMPYPYGVARLWHVSGELHLQKGEPARERLQEALALFWRLGARKDAERVAQALGEPGAAYIATQDAAW
jgi:tetratricopeptide (TPR) repeat protein